MKIWTEQDLLLSAAIYCDNFSPKSLQTLSHGTFPIFGQGSDRNFFHVTTIHIDRMTTTGISLMFIRRVKIPLFPD